MGGAGGTGRQLERESVTGAWSGATWHWHIGRARCGPSKLLWNAGSGPVWPSNASRFVDLERAAAAHEWVILKQGGDVLWSIGLNHRPTQNGTFRRLTDRQVASDGRARIDERGARPLRPHQEGLSGLADRGRVVGHSGAVVRDEVASHDGSSCAFADCLTRHDTGR